MQSKIIKFIALMFVGLVLCTITVSGRFGPGNRCECTGRPHFTRRCCLESEGFLRADRCHQELSGRFLRCCEASGVRGGCFT